MHRVAAQNVLVSVLTVFLGTLLAPKASHAAVVEKVKGAQAIIKLDEAEGTAAVGDKFFAMENGKRRGLLEVVQYKNGRAKVKIIKGRAQEGMTASVAKSATKPTPAEGETGATGDQPAEPAQETTEENTQATSETKPHREKRSRSFGASTLFKDITFGAVAGYSMDQQTVSPTGLATQNMSGSGMSLRAIADIPVLGALALYTRAGIEQFNVTSGSSKTEIMYAVGDLLLKYSFSETGFVPFVMGGLGLHFPLSKTTNVLDANRISSTTVFYGGAGFNWVVSGSTYVQVTGEYGMFPPANDVSTSIIAVRAGLGFRF